MAKSVPVVLQLSDTECGIASLAMLFAYYKVYVPLEELRDQCGESRDGCKATTLMTVAKHYGFDAEAYSIDADLISKLSAPVIAFWNFSHYVVIKKATRNRIYINDPALGATVLTKDEFSRAFTGVVLDITPSPTIRGSSKPRTFVSLLIEWLLPFQRELLFLACSILIVSISTYFNIGIYKLYQQTELHSILLWVAAICGSTWIIGSLLVRNIQFGLQHYACIIKSDYIIKHLLQLPMLFFSLRQRTEIIAIANRIEITINLLFKSSAESMIALLTILACLIIMLKIDYQLSIYCILLSCSYAYIYYFIAQLVANAEKLSIKHTAKWYSFLLTSVKNLETIKSCGLEETNSGKWRQFFLQKLMVKHKINSLTAIQSTLEKSYGIVLLFIILASSSALEHVITFYILQLILSANAAILFKSLNTLQLSQLQHSRVNDISLYKKDVRHLTNLALPMLNDMILECSDLSFSYNQHSKPVLQNISLQIKNGQHIAFVGSTGSGKSTLIKLLSGLYTPTTGEVFLYGNNINSYSAAQLAKLCAYVSQENYLFSGTLYENLTFWCNVEISAVYDACKLACLESLILERGIHAAVCEGGNNFSAGEKQRIEIARALIQNTPILILDEATSALDKDTQAQLIANLRNTNKTIIFIAHRLSSIAHCDRIYTIRNGILYTNHDKNINLDGAFL